MNTPPKKVQAPKTGKISTYLTNGKEYDVIHHDNDDDADCGYMIWIIDDEGVLITTTERDTIQLNGKNWIILERE